MDEIDTRTIVCVAAGVCIGLTIYDGIKCFVTKLVSTVTTFQNNLEEERIEKEKMQKKIDQLLQQNANICQ